ncbi:MAG TPA: 50S ribosomal protein L10 [Candidatus Thalassarchaeaceae archaeon]|nr:50S ribosomal protein L10 [Candidatus Thalassarchaeaceae archaeon]
MIPKAAQWKKDRVGQLEEIIKSEGIIGIVDISGVPATNMLDMRANLREGMTATMAKKTLIRRAWENAGLDSNHLDTLLDGVVQPMLVHSDKYNAFQLYAELDKTRQGRAAKDGEIAPADIVVEEGETEFAPGPIVGELGAVGIPAKIDKGKVVIQKSVTIVEAGNPIEGELGMMLSKLGINPIEIGLILSGVIEEGTVLPADSLNLDLDGLRNNIITAMSGAFNLACNVSWFASETMPTLLSKASSEAFNVAIEAGISNEKTIPVFISRAQGRALALAGHLDSSALDDELAGMLGAAASAVVVAETPSEEAAEAAEETTEEVEEEEEGGFGGLGDLFG